MIFGKFQIDVVDTSLFSLDGGAMFGVIPKNLWSKSYHQGDEMNRIPLAARPLLIKYDNKVILVDTGNGNKMPDKVAKIYDINIEESSIQKALSRLNVTTDQVTDVILTHLHFDHCGGATIVDDNRVVPTFKNAKYYLQQEHYNWALNPALKDRASFMKDNYQPLIESSQLELLDGEGDLFESISVHLFHGHTKAMQGVKIKTENQTLFYAADLMPTMSHIPLPYGLAYDNFPLTTIAEKEKILTQAVDENWLIIFEHDAFRQACYINKNEKGFFAGEQIKIT